MTVDYLSIESIKPHPDNPRLFLRDEVIEGIAAQIEASGEFDPAHALLVRPVNGHYQILRGHHRIEAAKKAGLDSVPCWVREMGDDEAYMQLALSNVQGELSPLEIGIHALRAIGLAEGGRGITGGLSEYARQLSKSLSSISEARAAAIVLNSLNPSDIRRVFQEKSAHLASVHKTPQELWPYLVQEMLSREWSAADTDKEIKKVKELVEVIPEWWNLGKLAIAQQSLNGGHSKVKAMLAYAGKTAVRLEIVTIHRLKETDITEERNGREYRKWVSEPVEFDARQVFINRVDALSIIPDKNQIVEIEKDILSYVQSLSGASEVWRPVLSDEEWKAEKVRLVGIARIEKRERYTPKLINADVLEGFRQIRDGTVDLICTDPPYNIGKAEWDSWESPQAYAEWCKLWLKECYRVLKDSGSLYVFGRFEMLHYVSIVAGEVGLLFQKDIVWDTIQGSGGAGLWPIRHEMILYFTKSDEHYEDTDSVKLERHEENVREYKGQEYNFKSPSTVWRFPCVDNMHPDRTDHPTQKPVELLERIVLANSPIDGLVLDCFMGSGSTGVAAMKLSRQSIGIEREKPYIDIALSRFDNTEVG